MFLLLTFVFQCYSEPDVREQPTTAGPDAHNDAADVGAATEPGNAANDVQPTGQFHVSDVVLGYGHMALPTKCLWLNKNNFCATPVIPEGKARGVHPHFASYV